MNILIPFSWLKDFLKTEASPEKVAEVLSLCSQSVEKIHSEKDDQILEIEITVNRYDCLSVRGIAREAAAALSGYGIKAEFASPKILPLEMKNPKFNLSVEIKDETLCPRFSAVVIDQVKVAPSPKWMAERLEKVGIRPLSNVVDISNYLMIETGQPIHTFDYDKILGAKMIMRLSRPGEKITTLDGATRTLPGGDIVIEDGKERLIDLCGIMGAENSQIDENTKRVLFFVQAYNPVRIRQTSMALAHRTEAAVRFERGIDLEGIIPVISQGVKLMEDLCQGRVASKLIDIYPNPQKSKKIKLDLDLVNKIIGIEIPKNKIISILESLGFSLLTSHFSRRRHRAPPKRGYATASSLWRRTALLTFSVPSFRAQDISHEEDLIEEIARIYGYFRLPGNIPPLHPLFGLLPQPQPQKGKIGMFFEYENKIKEVLVGKGFSEVYNYSFIGKDSIQKTGLKTEDHLKLKNPLTSDLEYLRISLLESLLKTVAQNQANFPKVKIFEMANVYLPQKGNLPLEKTRLTCLVTGEDFSYLKGISEIIFEHLGIEDIHFKPWVGREPYFSQGKAAVMETTNNVLGTIGEVNPRVLANFEILNKTVVLDLDFEALILLAKKTKTFTPIPKYPAIVEDLAFVVPPKTLIGDLLQLIKVSSSIIQSVELIDIHGDTRTFRIIYQHPKKTLTDKEVEKIREKIISAVKSKFGAILKTL
ncbi:MAG: phenylalanine--tRNA ligase subunit beta [Patescibacteria group bacterium]